MSIKTIQLVNFRNHSQLSLDTDAKYINIVGSNGSGKTNILEAISFLSPGKGMRKAHLNDVTNIDKSQQGWAVLAKCSREGDDNTIATSCLNKKRVFKLNETVLKRSGDILEHLRVIWLMPTMDNILAESSSIKRRFFDRICYNFFPLHASHIVRYERAMQQRNRLLKDQINDDLWLSSLESIMAEEALKICHTRAQSLMILTTGLASFSSEFLKPILKIEGKLESLIAEKSHDEALAQTQATLKQHRPIDGKAKRALFGAHKSEIKAQPLGKMIAADLCSTGELKAMVISIILAQCFSIRQIFNGSVILLLDDIFSHLDKNMRQNLLKEIAELDVQVWISSTESVEELNQCKDYIKVLL